MIKKQTFASLFMFVMALLGGGAGYFLYHRFFAPIVRPTPVSPSEPVVNIPPPPRQKISENETPRSQDRLFYHFNYFSTDNMLRLAFTLQANDAQHNINGLAIDRSTPGEPVLMGPTTVTVRLDEKNESSSDWRCKTTETQIRCVGTEILQLNEPGSLTLIFDTIPVPPKKLTVHLLEKEQPIATLMPLLQK